jgi:hypothetical protein
LSRVGHEHQTLLNEEKIEPKRREYCQFDWRLLRS